MAGGVIAVGLVKYKRGNARVQSGYKVELVIDWDGVDASLRCWAVALR